MKYIHSDAVLFLTKKINFVQPILPYWTSSFTSSSMEERWKMIAFAKLRHNFPEISSSSDH